MKLGALLFTFLTYGLFLAVYTGGDGNLEEFPTFDPPGIEFRTVPSSCSGFLDCTEYVGDIIVNFVLGVVYVVLLLVEIVRLLVELLILAVINAFAGLNGAPIWLNVGIISFFGIGFALAIYRAVRSGETET